MEKALLTAPDESARSATIDNSREVKQGTGWKGENDGRQVRMRIIINFQLFKLFFKFRTHWLAGQFGNGTLARRTTYWIMRRIVTRVDAAGKGIGDVTQIVVSETSTVLREDAVHQHHQVITKTPLAPRFFYLKRTFVCSTKIQKEGK